MGVLYIIGEKTSPISSCVMYQGEFIVRMDDRGRVPFPARLLQQIREMFPSDSPVEEFVLIRGLEACLFLYPLPSWKRFMENLRKIINLADAQHRWFLRRLQRHSALVSLDGHQRILIPRPLREYAGLKNEVSFLPMFEYVELWDPQRMDQDMPLSPEQHAELFHQLMHPPKPVFP